MSQMIVNEELRAKLSEGQIDLCEPDGKVVGYAMTVEQHKRFVYDLLRQTSDTPEALARQERAYEAYRRGECLTSTQMWQKLRDAGIDTEAR